MKREHYISMMLVVVALTACSSPRSDGQFLYEKGVQLRDAGRIEEAKKTFIDAARKGDAQAMWELSQIYGAQEVDLKDRIARRGSVSGETASSKAPTVANSDVQAADREMIRWATKAAEQGIYEAEVALGGYYGLGTPSILKDNVRAYVWLSVAEENAPDTAARQDNKATVHIFERGMTKSQIEEAKSLLKEQLAALRNQGRSQ